MKKFMSAIIALFMLITFAVSATAATTYVDTSWVSTTSASDLGGMYACMYSETSTDSEVVMVFRTETAIQIQFDLDSLTWVSAKCGNKTGYMRIDQVNYTATELRQALFGGYTMQRGFEGQPVKNLQLCLAQLLYDTNGIDGIYGSGTQQAVKSFQANCGLEDDGIAGSLTQDALIERVFPLP